MCDNSDVYCTMTASKGSAETWPEKQATSEDREEERCDRGITGGDI